MEAPNHLPEPENRLHYPALDGWRAIAFLMVFLQHYLHVPYGYTGVDLFFVLSGFLITGILYDSRDRPDRVRTFYLRRTLRIFPLFYGVLLVLLLLTPVFHFVWTRWWFCWPAYLGNFLALLHPYRPGPALYLASLGMLGTGGGTRKLLFLGHFWSLCVEEQFYLLWPWVVFWVRNRVRLLYLSLSIVCATLMARVLLRDVLPSSFPFENLLNKATPLRADALVLGGVLALLLRGSYKEVVLRWAKPLACAMGSVALVYWALHLHTADPVWKFTWGATYVDVFFAALLACALAPGNPVYRIGNVARLRWMGRISYGLYVFHDIPHRLYYAMAYWCGAHVSVLGTLIPQVTALIAFPCTVALAWASFRFYETPFLALKERLAPAHKRKAPVEVAA